MSLLSNLLRKVKYQMRMILDLFLKTLSRIPFLIMGAGYVHIRKGIGVFIGVADREKNADKK